MFARTIVRIPCENMSRGITCADLGLPDYGQALSQHQSYINALEQCGLAVTILEPEPDYPDSVFIEDTALLTSDCAIVTRPGADSRKGEVGSVKRALDQFYDEIHEIPAPGSLDAGDIMMVGSHFYIGLSDRTNQPGAQRMIEILNRHGMTASTITMAEMLHLKTGLSYLENNNLLITGEFVGKEEFAGFNQIIVDDDEAYAANSVWINDKVLVPAGYPRTSCKISALGYQVIELEMSEFQKLDGGLSCLSLRF